VKHRGFTIVEVSIAALLLALIFTTASSAVWRDTQAHQVLIAPFGAEMRAQSTLENLAAELRMAGEWAEDRDQDHELDPGEDTNLNGSLDAGWNLPDGTIDQPTLTFNRRIDVRDADGNVKLAGVYSRNVTYLLEEDRLIREWELTDPTGVLDVNRAVVARRIAGLRFSRKGQIVFVEIDVAPPSSDASGRPRTLSTEVWLRH